jgi:hypothetical protein
MDSIDDEILRELKMLKEYKINYEYRPGVNPFPSKQPNFFLSSFKRQRRQKKVSQFHEAVSPTPHTKIMARSPTQNKLFGLRRTSKSFLTFTNAAKKAAEAMAPKAKVKTKTVIPTI